MARIKEMLGEKVISGFRGKLDYYYWMGIACVRRWPKSPRLPRSPGVVAAQQPFIQAASLWRTTPQYLQDFYNTMASGTGLSGRDMFMRAYMSGWKKLVATVDELE